MFLNHPSLKMNQTLQKLMENHGAAQGFDPNKLGELKIHLENDVRNHMRTVEGYQQFKNYFSEQTGNSGNRGPPSAAPSLHHQQHKQGGGINLTVPTQKQSNNEMEKGNKSRELPNHKKTSIKSSINTDQSNFGSSMQGAGRGSNTPGGAPNQQDEGPPAQVQTGGGQ